MHQKHTWKRAQQSRVSAVEMNYLNNSCGLMGWNGNNNGAVFEGCDSGARTVDEAHGVTGMAEYTGENAMYGDMGVQRKYMGI